MYAANVHVGKQFRKTFSGSKFMRTRERLSDCLLFFYFRVSRKLQTTWPQVYPHSETQERPSMALCFDKVAPAEKRLLVTIRRTRKAHCNSAQSFLGCCHRIQLDGGLTIFRVGSCYLKISFACFRQEFNQQTSLFRIGCPPEDTDSRHRSHVSVWTILVPLAPCFCLKCVKPGGSLDRPCNTALKTDPTGLPNYHRCLGHQAFSCYPSSRSARKTRRNLTWCKQPGKEWKETRPFKTSLAAVCSGVTQRNF